MPHEVIMPALGMAQETGQILAWHKKPGEAVAEGEVLFEVETDKAAMEVAAQKEGYLTDVSAEAGADIPVGQVIALISDTPEDTGAPTAANGAPEQTSAETDSPADGLPEGNEVIMPTLGMAQDTGLLIGWQKQPGDAVAADDVLFEVETDKSTVEVNAGFDGYVAALLAEAGEDVPVGQTIAVISAEKPESPVSRSAKAAEPASPAPSRAEPEARQQAEMPATDGPAVPGVKPAAVPAENQGKILASPKVRRLAREQGLDLGRLTKAGHAQPFHVADLEALKSLPAAAPTSEAAAAVPARHLSAELDGEGFAEFTAWAADNAGISDKRVLLAGFAAASLGRMPVCVAVERDGRQDLYSVPALRLGEIGKSEPGSTPDIKVRDLRRSRITSLQLGAEDCPVISIAVSGKHLRLTLECAGHHLAAEDAVSLLSNFAGRMEQPLRHLL